MPYARISGWGMYVPSNVVTNENLVEKGLDTSDEWITSRTGIKERRLIDQNEATSDLAVKAARRALGLADLHPGDIDLILVATCTPDHSIPATASIVQDKLGAFRAGAMDVNAGCSGFVYALTVAAGQIESGRNRRVLVVGAEALSTVVDWKDRNTCVLFGDGAGAMILEVSDEPGILSASLGSDGSGANLLIVPEGGSRHPFGMNGSSSGGRHLKMDGRQVFRFSTQMLGKASEKAIEDSGLTPEDIDLFVPHQANLRIIESMAKKLDLSMEKVFVNIDKYGNTSAASIPIALCEAIEEGRLKVGDSVLLTGFGAGLTWSATVIRWGMALPVHVSRWVWLSRQLEIRLARLRSLYRRIVRRIRVWTLWRD